MSFGENLYKIRKEKGLSQEELANLVGISRQAVSKWELGEAMPDLINLNAMADALDMSIDELCERKIKTAQIPKNKPKKTFWKIAVLCIICVAAGIFIGAKFLNFTYFPNVITTSNVSFTKDFKTGGTKFSFTPGGIGKECSYEVNFIPLNEMGKPIKAEAVFEYGICTGTVKLIENLEYSVNAEAIIGNESRVLLLAGNLVVQENGVSYTWP